MAKVIDVVLDIHKPESEAVKIVFENLADLLKVKAVEELETKLVCGGITNCLIQVYNKDDSSFAVLVRIFGINTEAIIDRDLQEEAEPYLGAHGVGKQVYATFTNGQIESWINGRTLAPEEMTMPFTASRIAQAVARLHCVPPADFLTHHGGSKLWHTLFSWLEKCREYKKEHQDLRARLFDFDDLERDLKMLKKEADKLDVPSVVCHMDLLSGNVLEKDNGEICFIDFEYVCVAECAFDLANHFNECVGFNCEWNKLPTEAQMKHFIKHYLRSLPANHAVVEWAGEDDKDGKLLYATQLYQLASHYFWGLWALIQAYNSTVDFDYYVYAFNRLSAIFNKKIRNGLVPSSCCDPANPRGSCACLKDVTAITPKPSVPQIKKD